ncbi:uncharacterized protein RHOBADRAFT_51235 [Rhodotorula graminis WP1]|uniref:Uncharacterized protein n=1 Tax=Rhodotorula graminis (strain WP1) TaxID=578459 RepID=A0A194S9V4_RHOGW|nr:uncharacterized protein RHOBADRAFT_51235 [Rhodotorula graminis WP1]KPV77369.1 hypothetical protein RHOBADRAFT_51235 [Rhodotorula graminis WP1]
MSGSPRPWRPPALSPAPRPPPPFLRRPSSVSSSSFLSTTTSSLSEPSSDDDSSSDDSSSDDDAPTESYWSSSGLSGDEGRFVARLDLSLRAPTSGGGGSSSGTASIASSLGPGQAGTASPIARSNLRLSLAVLRARQSLAAHSFDALASSLKSLSSALPSLSALSRPPSAAPGPGTENPLGVFVPTLARLAGDVRAALRDEGGKGREFRRTKLARDDAKALVGLRQRWSTGAAAGGKGKGRETDSLEWVPVVEAALASNPPPDFLAAAERFDHLTPSLLTSLEAFLLPSSLPRLSFSDLALTDTDLATWPALRRLEDVAAWYLSFVVGDPDEARKRARTALDGVKSLDLSKNKLTTFPLYLTRLFPHLETLSLSHNAFAHLPPWVTLFPSLRRLRTHGNRLVSARKALKPLARPKDKPARARAHPRRAGTRADVRDVLPVVRAAVLRAPLEALLPSSRLGSLPSLFSIAAQLAHEQLVDAEVQDGAATDNFLPPHLHDVLAAAYTCASCRSFVLPSSPISVPPFSERAHHLDPGISLPSRLPPPVPAPTRFSPPTTPTLASMQQPQHQRPRYLSAAERPATLEQRLLLALLARLDAPPPPPRPPASRRRDSEASLSSLASAPPPRRPRSARDEHEHDSGRRALPTLVLGAAGAVWRFCAPCAAAHVGLEDDFALRAEQEEKWALASEEGGQGLADELERLGRWRCTCVVCCEERRVRGWDEVEGEEGSKAAGVGEGEKGKDEPTRTRVLRWFRRKEQTRGMSALLVAAVEG